MQTPEVKQPETRKTYTQPNLIEYGSVAELTQEFSAAGLIVTASVTATVLGPVHV